MELGSEVHIDMLDDRLEIYSSGGLLDEDSINDMAVMNMSSRRRNTLLAYISVHTFGGFNFLSAEKLKRNSTVMTGATKDMSLIQQVLQFKQDGESN